MAWLKTLFSAQNSRLDSQLGRFIAIGLANTALAYGVYVFGLAIGLPYYLASLLSLVIGIAVSFVSQGKLTFDAALKGRFGLFVAVWALLYFANLSVIAGLNVLGAPFWLAGLVAIAPITGLSFLLQRGVVFAEQRVSWRVLLVGAVLLACAILRFNMLFRYEINWDEFLNLSMVYDHRRGDLREVFQTAFIHLFQWLPVVSPNEVDQIIAGRMLVFAIAAATSTAIYGIARRFTSIEAALFGVLAYNAFSFVFQHGSSLRTDPLATCAIMVAIWVCLSSRWDWWRAGVVGVLVGLAGLLTIKAIFLVPALAGVLLARLAFEDEKPERFLWTLSAGLIALGALVGGLVLHAATFEKTASASAFVARTSAATLGAFDFGIVTDYLLKALLANAAFWGLLIAGLTIAIGKIRHPSERAEGLILASMALPLLSPLIYRDVYPYYYVMMLAPAAVLVGLGFEKLVPLRKGAYMVAVLMVIGGATAILYTRSLDTGPGAQRQVVGLVHKLFPEPVAYIDRTSMISSFPKRGPFLSQWGVTDYRAAGVPVIAHAIQTDEPKFVLANRWQLNLDERTPNEADNYRFALLGQDMVALKSTYVRYWGPLYVPGFAVPAGETKVDVRIAGRYSLHIGDTVTVDGRSLDRGAALLLEKGRHRIVAEKAVQLRWTLPEAPITPAPTELFHGL